MLPEGTREPFSRLIAVAARHSVDPVALLEILPRHQKPPPAQIGRRRFADNGCEGFRKPAQGQSGDFREIIIAPVAPRIGVYCHDRPAEPGIRKT